MENFSLTSDDIVREPLFDLGRDAEPEHTPEFQSSEAAKLHLALRDKSPGMDEISASLSSGNSEVYRRMLADQDQVNRIQTRSDIIDSVLQANPKEITPEVVDLLRGLSDQEVQSPDLSDIIEKKYAELYTNTAATMMGNGLVDDAYAEDPEATMDALDRTERAVYWKNYYEKKRDEANKLIEDQSLIGATWNVIENAIIGRYQTYNAVGDVEGVNEDFFSDVLPGDNRIEQYAYLNSISDLNERKRVLDGVVEDLKSRNPYALKDWLDGYESYGSFNSIMETGEAAFDVVTALPLGLAVKGAKTVMKGGKLLEGASEAGKIGEVSKVAKPAVKKLENALEGAVKGSAKNPQDIEKIAKDVGKYDKAAEGHLIKKMQRDGDPLTIRKAEEVSDATPSLSDPLRMMRGYDNAPQAATTRLSESLLERATLAEKFLTEINRPMTLTPDELVRYADSLRDDYVKLNPSTEKNIIDVEVPDVPDVGGVYRANIIFGKRDGTLFESPEQADNYFKRWIKGTDDYSVEQVGEGFRIVVPKNINHNKLLKDVVLNTSQTTPSSMSDISNWLSALRTPTEQLSNQQNVARSVVTSSKEMMDHIYSRMSQPFSAMSSKEARDLDTFLETNTRRGVSQDNVGEFIDQYYRVLGSNPTEKQIDAYLASVQINDLDLWIRDLSVYQQKARQGVEEMTLSIPKVADDGSVVSDSLKFEGAFVDDLPYSSSEPFKVAVVENGKVRSSKISTLIGEKDRAAFKRMKENGYRFVNAKEADFKIGDRYYDYVVTKDVKSNRIGVSNFQKQPGGHKIYRDPYYIKQAKMSGDEDLRFYRGDNSFFNFKNRSDAERFAPILEEARLKYKENVPDALKFIRDNLPISTREWIQAVKDGKISLDVPFVVTKSGLRTMDTPAMASLKNVRDVTRSEHKMQLQGRFLGERSEGDLNTIMSEEGTLFKVEPARLLSPTKALSSAMSDSINIRAFDDYRLMSRDNFIREFGDLLEGDLNSQLASGFDAIVNPVFRKGAEIADPRRYQRAVNVSRAYNNFVSGSYSSSAKLEALKESIVEKAAPALSKLSSGRQQWVEEKLLESAAHPGAFLKSLAFDFKMGFWNPWQYFKQANSMVNIVSIAGQKGFRSAVLYPFMRAAMKTGKKDFIKDFGRRAEKLGLMKAHEFEESMTLYKKSGFNHIGHDLSYLDDLRSPELRKGVVTTNVSKVMKTSTRPFEEGERMTRLSAWNAAYLEKKEALKGRAITPRDEADILYRAKTLIGNMTRESNAPWQKGYLSAMTQFFSYQTRIMDQFLGKQLTAAERGRLFLGYSAAYGMPVAVAGVSGVIPVRDWLIDKMNEEGMDTNDPALSFFTDGFVSGMTNLMFDKKWNISSSYGPGGIPTFWDLLAGDKEAAEVFMGAGGGIAWTTLKDTMPIFKAMASEFMDFDGGYHNLTIEDMVKPLRNITSVDSLTKLVKVYNTGIWASKNGYNLMEMDLPEAVFSVITGLQPQELEDSFSKYRAGKNQKEWFKIEQKRLISEIKKLHEMEDSTTRDQMTKELKAEMVSLGFNNREMAQTWKYAADESLLTDVFQKNFQKVVERKERQRHAKETMNKGEQGG